MKESRETLPKPSSSLLDAGRWQHRGSTSSHRSARSIQSLESHKSRKSRSIKSRPRRFSLSSTHSQAVSVNSSSSVGTNTLSRKTSHADDSDASDTNESLGETDEDVWFPNDAPNSGDINMDELDQLLNLSDEEDLENTMPSFYRRKSGHSDAGSPEGAGAATLGSLPSPVIKPSTDGLNSPTLERHKYQSQRKKSTGVASPSRFDLDVGIPEERDADVAEAAEHDKNNEPLSPLTRKTFVEYHPSVDPSYRQPSERFDPNTFRAGSSSSNSSERKYEPPFGSENSSSGTEKKLEEDEIDGQTHESTSEQRHLVESEPIRKHFSRSQPGIQPENTAITGGDDQQSQRYSFFAPGIENTIHAPDLASLVGESHSFSSLFNPDNGTWYLDCFRPTDVEMKALSRAFGIHPLTTEDIQTEDAREKFESFKNYYLVVYHTFENDKEDANYMEIINFYVLVFKEGVISFHFEPVSHCRNVRRRMRQLRDYLSFTPDWIAYALIDDITDSFAPEIQGVEREADFVEDAVYLDSDGSIEMSTLLRRLGEGRRHTMHLLRMLSGKADVVRGFAKRVNERGMPSEMNLYLGDIQDHIVTMYQNLSAYEKIFSRTHFNYMGLLQMEFVDSSNRMTGVLGKVTILGTVLVPMNLITGLFGMNVRVPGQDVENLRWFFGVLGLVLFLIITLLLGSALYVKFSINRRNPTRLTT